MVVVGVLIGAVGADGLVRSSHIIRIVLIFATKAVFFISNFFTITFFRFHDVLIVACLKNLIT